MSFKSDFLKGFFGNAYLKDYSHASKIFRSDGFALSPQYKFLFHVNFNLNIVEIPRLAEVFSRSDRDTLSLLLKTVELPSYQIDVETMNQYNRKRLVQKKLEYQPCQITFHDDGSDLIRSLWYNYFSYYYKDPSQLYSGITTTNSRTSPQNLGAGTQSSYSGRDIYADQRLVNDWGFVGESLSGNGLTTGKPAFFNDITIYGFNQHKFAAYVLINPLITDWHHDAFDYSQGNSIMEHKMTVKFETVKYFQGVLDKGTPKTTVKGFADPSHYDTDVSPLDKLGNALSILGKGGAVDTVGGIVNDLQSGSLLGVLGAVQKSGSLARTFKNQNLSGILKTEGTGVVTDVLRDSNSVKRIANSTSGFLFPKVPNNTTPSPPYSPKVK